MLFRSNIGGVLTGAILGGFVILPHFGLDILSRALAVSLVLALFLIFQKSRASYLHAVPLGILAMIIVLASPSFEKTLLTSGYFYNRIHTGDVKDYHSYYDSLQSFHDMYRYALVDYKDDAHGTVSIHEYVNNPEERWFRIDGKTDGNRRGDVATVRLLDYFPQIFAGNFENILTIGLGTGESASLTHEIQGMKTSKVIELSPSMIEFSRKHFPENSFHVWSDPRIKVVNRDAREYLLHTKEKFDLSMTEPSNPWVNGVASLFTLEFFRSIASHLKPGGIASVWFHSYGLSCDAFESVMLAAYHAFPNLIVFKRSGDFYFIASNDHPLELKPLPPERRHLEAKILGMLDDKPLSGDVTEAYATALSNAVWVRNRKQLERFARYGKFNTDDNQFLQYSGGRTFRRGISCFMSYF